jgi:hypothetical protein
MYITTSQSQVRSLKEGDKHFKIHDKLTVTNRAGFEIDPRCPQNHVIYITNAIDKGWLRPVAYVTERELLFMGLNDDK